MKKGRPSLRTPELEDKIIGLIEEGYSECQIAKMDGMPTAMTIRRWKDEDKDFCARSVRALALHVHKPARAKCRASWSRCKRA